MAGDAAAISSLCSDDGLGVDVTTQTLCAELGYGFDSGLCQTAGDQGEALFGGYAAATGQMLVTSWLRWDVYFASIRTSLTPSWKILVKNGLLKMAIGLVSVLRAL